MARSSSSPFGSSTESKYLLAHLTTEQVGDLLKAGDEEFSASLVRLESLAAITIGDDDAAKEPDLAQIFNCEAVQQIDDMMRRASERQCILNMTGMGVTITIQPRARDESPISEGLAHLARPKVTSALGNLVRALAETKNAVNGEE